MDWNFYGLREDPFGLTPDTRFLYLTESHQEVLSTLRESIEGQRGFVALVSQPGLGKTTLLFQLLEELRRTAVTAFVFQTTFDPLDILRLLWKELGLDSSQADVVKMHQQFEDGLARVAAMGKQFVLVVDEAQNLSPAALETIRLLANFESYRKKMVQIVIAGHPELESLLARPGLEHIKQRIAAFCRLKPFTLAETRQYVQHRIRTAGHTGAPVFTDEAVTVLAELSKGIPRTLNIYAFQAMMKGAKKGVRTIDANLMRQAIHQFEDWPEPKPEPKGDIFAPIADGPLREEWNESEISPGLEVPPPAERELEVMLESMRSDMATAGLGGHTDAQLMAEPVAPTATTGAAKKADALPKPSPRPTIVERMPAAMAATAPVMQRESITDTRVEVSSIAERISVMPLKAPSLVASATTQMRARRKGHHAFWRNPLMVRVAAVTGIVVLLAGGAWISASQRWVLPPAPTVRAAAPADAGALVSTSPVAVPNPVTVAPAEVHPAASTAAPAPSKQAISAPALDTVVTEIAAGRSPAVENDAPAPSTPLTALSAPSNAGLSPALLAGNSQAVSLRAESILRPPVPTTQPKPLYPAIAAQLRRTGIVVLRVQVNAEGRPTRVDIVSGDAILASSAQNTVRNLWRFNPASVNGKPVSGETEVRINFRGR